MICPSESTSKGDRGILNFKSATFEGASMAKGKFNHVEMKIAEEILGLPWRVLLVLEVTRMN